MLLQKIHVKKDERALLFARGDFVDVLGPGVHWAPGAPWDVKAERFDMAKPRFEHRLASYLQFSDDARVRAVVEREFHDVRVGAREVGLRYENGVLVELLAPNTKALFWKGYLDVRVDRVDIDASVAAEPRIAREILAARSTLPGLSMVLGLQVSQYQQALLYLNGRVERVVEPGQHVFWRVGHDLRTEVVDVRPVAIEVAGQEILTRDKVALRVNLVAGYRIADALAAFAKQVKPAEFVYRELQFGLRAAVGTRTLDELLENKGVIDAVVAAHVEARISGMGLVLDSVGVKDIILPGDMKTILTRVVEAEKAAQANVIRRREETAATRSLLNTAKVMEDNPTALRLKELETLEKVTEKIDRISVFGGLDTVLKDLVRIRA